MRASQTEGRPQPQDSTASEEVRKYVSWGAGPRASQYLVLGAKARAAMDGRGVADLDDVSSLSDAVLRHRVLSNFRAEAEGVGVSALLARVGKEARSTR